MYRERHWLRWPGMTRLLVALLVLWIIAACSSGSGGGGIADEELSDGDNTDGGTDVSGDAASTDGGDMTGDDVVQTVVAPPDAPREPTLPMEYLEALPQDEEGRPIIIEVPANLPPTWTVQVVFDDTLDDPITHWGDCLSRVVSCRRNNPNLDLVPQCVALIERCETDAGDFGCCPSSCVDDYMALIERGRDHDTASEETFIEGSCVEGLFEFRDEFGPLDLEVSP